MLIAQRTLVYVMHGLARRSICVPKKHGAICCILGTNDDIKDDNL